MTSRLPNLLGGAALLAAFAFGFANVATAQTITVNGCSSFTTTGGTSSNLTITCNTGVVGGPTAPSCSGANIALAGSTLTFTATCTQGTNPITSVTLNGVSLCSGAACTNPSSPVSVPGLAVPLSTTNYIVTASDGQLQGSSSATFVVGSGGGGAIDLSGCTAAGYTGRGLDITFPTVTNTSIGNGANAAAPKGSFGNNDALVVRFTTPAAGVNDQTVFQPAGNAPSQNTGRVYTLSTQPCQFATSSTPTGSILYATSSQSPAITVNVKACPYTGAYAGYCNMAAYLQPNTTYYVTMVNRTGFGGAGSCLYGSCDMRIDFNK
jgi:hypothetical protein